LELIEGNIFKKDKCAWVKKRVGRQMGLKTPIINSQFGSKSICLLLPIAQYNMIQKKALEETKKRNKPISIPMIVREALKVSFPFMDQKDLFE